MIFKSSRSSIYEHDCACREEPRDSVATGIGADASRDRQF
jgi:hypothetical protein